MLRMLPSIAVLLAFAAPAAAVQQPVGLGVKPFTLTSDPNAKKVNVGVTADGTGVFAWDVTAPGDDPLVVCRVPRGQRACASPQTIPLPLESFGEPQVLVAGATVVLVTHRGYGTGEGTYAIVSTDNGATWGTPAVVGDVEPGQAALWPATGMVALTDDVVDSTKFQAAPLGGPAPATHALLGASGQGYSGTIGFDGANPMVAFDDLHQAFLRIWSGAGNVNDAASWGAAQPLGALSELRIATGPKGNVLMAKRETPNGTRYVARRFDPATHAFGKAVSLSGPFKLESDVIFRDVFEDPGGNVAAVWDANHSYGSHSDPLRYRVSTDGGVTWKRERTLVSHVDDSAFNLQLGAAADGGGFLAWDSNDHGPLKAVPIPPIAKQGSGIPPKKHKKKHRR